jgi:ABC-type transport system involved in multi-copper enzyme maturation permease subunit
LVGLLGVLGVTTWQASIGFNREATLGETAAFGLLLFQIVAYVLLLLTLFFAILSAAGAVAQEKDRRTFVLLLITDMHDYEIVLGKMLGALLPITIQLAIAAPVLSLLLFLGGIAPEQVVQTLVILLASAVAAGSLGALVALWRERTFQALALSVLFLALYLGAVQAVGLVLPLVMHQSVARWVQACVDPLAALQTVLAPPQEGWAGLTPAYGFAMTMLLWTVVLNAVGIWGLRRWNPSGEPIVQRETPEELEELDASQELEKRAKAHAAPGPVRRVWHNPILWREVRTLAYGRRPLLVKLAFAVVLLFIVYFAYIELYRPGGRPLFVAAYGLVPLTILSLLLVAAQAVTAITSERDGGTLDILLVTDISPNEFVFGKILGVAYNCKEYILPPLLLALYYAVVGAFSSPNPEMNWRQIIETNLGPFLAVVGALVILFVFVTVLGVHVALRIANSRQAIVQTLGTVFFLSVGTLIAIYLIIINGGSFANQWLSFLAFLAVGIGGLLYVFSADRPSTALTLASVACPLAMFYGIVTVLIGKPGTQESVEPLMPFLALAGAFGLAIAAMLVPLLSEFDVALGRTVAPEET